MAIERVVLRQGKETKVDTLLPGSRERLSSRGFLRRLADELIGDNKVTVAIVEYPDKIKVSEMLDIRNTLIEKQSTELEKDQINAAEVRTGQFGVRKKEILYRWVSSENTPQGH